MPQPQTDTDRANTIAAIKTALAGVTSPALTVVDGPPWNITADRQCFFWYEGGQPTEEGQGLLDRSFSEKFMIAVYWLPPQSQQSYSQQMAEAWNASRNIQQAIDVHATLGELVEIVYMGAAKAGIWVDFSGNRYYALEIPIELTCYGADTLGR